MTIETTQSPPPASNWCVSRARPSRARAPPSSRLATPKSQTPLRLTDAVLAQRSRKCPETRTPRRIPRGHPTLREEDGVPSRERVRREAGLRRRNDIRERATRRFSAPRATPAVEAKAPPEKRSCPTPPTRRETVLAGVCKTPSVADSARRARRRSSANATAARARFRSPTVPSTSPGAPPIKSWSHLSAWFRPPD